jgi:hypothetical protein
VAVRAIPAHRAAAGGGGGVASSPIG